MEYVVFETGGKQYKAKEGDIIEVEQINNTNASNSLYDFDKVLLYVNDSDVKIGKPYISNFSVRAKILENIRGKKIRVARFTAKSRHRRVVGFRPSLTRLQIEKISPK